MRKYSPIVAAAALVALMAGGCAVDNGYSVYSNNTNTAQAYLPLQDGYTVIYQVEQVNGGASLERFEVGRQVSFGDGTAFEWIRNSSSGGSGRSYMQINDDCILFFENGNADAEKILQLPLTLGASWNRYDGADNGYSGTDGGFGDLLDDQQFTDDDSSITPGGVNEGKTDVDGSGGEEFDDPLPGSFPIDGSLEMVVDQIGPVHLTSGESYSHAVRIRNGGSSGHSNYYWFVQGIGLVKYVLNSSDANGSTGQTVGELVSITK